MAQPDYQAIRDFWIKHVDELNGGQLTNAIAFDAHMCGSIVDDFYERIQELDKCKILEGDPDFIRLLSKSQLLGCIGFHFRAVHFDDHHFDDPEMVYSLQRYIQAWLACPID